MQRFQYYEDNSGKSILFLVKEPGNILLMLLLLKKINVFTLLQMLVSIFVQTKGKHIIYRICVYFIVFRVFLAIRDVSIGI